jgi:succinate dehydrogenase/fumarate reductase flavoprotein subunit
LGGPQPTEEEVRKVVDILAAHGIWYKKSDTIEGLATQLGLSPEKVRNTVDRYNGFCAAGVDEEFHKSKATLLSLKKPPYYGMAIGRLLLITVGGLLTDNQMHVLDADHNVIPGLYAVGTLSGDYFSNCYTTHMPGNNLGRCLTFGYLTGRQLAKETI